MMDKRVWTHYSGRNIQRIKNKSILMFNCVVGFKETDLLPGPSGGSTVLLRSDSVTSKVTFLSPASRGRSSNGG